MFSVSGLSRPRRFSIVGIVAVAITMLVGCRGGGGAPAGGAGVVADPPRNVLFISIDTLRADHLGCYGYPRPTSPNIDALAAGAHRFARAYTAMPTTLPAHTAMFTSQYPSQLAVTRNGEQVPEAATTLAELLAGAGLATGAFVSALPLNPRFGLAQGFDAYQAPQGRPTQPAHVTLEQASVWLADNADDRFFLFVHLFDPHTPYAAPARYREKFDAPKRGPVAGIAFVRDRALYTAEAVQSSINGYDAEIAYADYGVGELLGELSARGIADDTLVVLTSDHGETLGELLDLHGYAFDHGEFLYAHQLHVPLIIRVPGAQAPAPAVHSVPVGTIDLAPTILELLGLPVPETMEGRSLAPLLRGGALEQRPVFTERRSFQGAVRPVLEGDDASVISGKWQLMVSAKRRNELFDLVSAEAPREVGTDREPAVVEELTRLTRRWRRGNRPLYGGAQFEVDPEVRERLRGLGYVE